MIPDVLITVTGPSGVGKTSLRKRILENEAYKKRLEAMLGKPVIALVTSTTRKKRENEVNAIDYFFIENTSFEGGIQAGLFAEYQKVYKEPVRYYGLHNSQLELAKRHMSIGFVVTDVDGAHKFREAENVMAASGYENSYENSASPDQKRGYIHIPAGFASIVIGVVAPVETCQERLEARDGEFDPKDRESRIARLKYEYEETKKLPWLENIQELDDAIESFFVLLESELKRLNLGIYAKVA